MTQLQAQADALAAQVKTLQGPSLLLPVQLARSLAQIVTVKRLSCRGSLLLLSPHAHRSIDPRCEGSESSRSRDPGLTRAVPAQVQALEGLGQENSRLAASNEAIVKHLSSNASPSVSPGTPALCQVL